MKIELDYPYNDYNGYIVVNPENRKNVCMVHKKDKSRTTISYARYLMSVKEGRILLQSEQIDHIDGNKTNDTIDNLQILSVVENNRKNIKERNAGMKMVDMRCPICEKIFTREYRNTHFQKGGHITTCSRDCLYQLLRKGYTVDVLKEIGEKQVIKKFRNSDVSPQAYTL